jgi:hypothetical protein
MKCKKPRHREVTRLMALGDQLLRARVPYARRGFLMQSPPRPVTVAWHCRNDENEHCGLPPVSLVRWHHAESLADAGTELSATKVATAISNERII